MYGEEAPLGRREWLVRVEVSGERGDGQGGELTRRKGRVFESIGEEKDRRLSQLWHYKIFSWTGDDDQSDDDG